MNLGHKGIIYHKYNISRLKFKAIHGCVKLELNQTTTFGLENNIFYCLFGLDY